MKCVKVIIILLILTGGSCLAFFYSGVINVAATAPDGLFTRWVLGTVRERSIDTRLGSIQVPPLTDPRMIETGFVHYNGMCVGCHLAPGMNSSEMRLGLNPRPPILARAVPYTSPAKLFWIIRNGIKMTGMPAWGPSHDDQEIWAIVAFLETLPHMTAAEYRAMQQQTRQMDMDHDEGMQSTPMAHGTWHADHDTIGQLKRGTPKPATSSAKSG